MCRVATVSLDFFETLAEVRSLRKSDAPASHADPAEIRNSITEACMSGDVPFRLSPRQSKAWLLANPGSVPVAWDALVPDMLAELAKSAFTRPVPDRELFQKCYDDIPDPNRLSLTTASQLWEAVEDLAQNMEVNHGDLYAYIRHAPNEAAFQAAKLAMIRLLEYFQLPPGDSSIAGSPDLTGVEVSLKRSGHRRIEMSISHPGWPDILHAGIRLPFNPDAASAGT